jgi:hypothetical protein
VKDSHAYCRAGSEDELAAFIRKVKSRFHVSDSVRWWADGPATGGANLEEMLAQRGAKLVIFRELADAGRDLAEVARNVSRLLGRGVTVLALDVNVDNFPLAVTQFVLKKTVDALVAGAKRFKVRKT